MSELQMVINTAKMSNELIKKLVQFKQMPYNEISTGVHFDKLDRFEMNRVNV